MSSPTRYALLGALVAVACVGRTDTSAPEPAVRCDTASDPQAFCQEAFGATFSCLPSANASYCVRSGCDVDQDCAHFSIGCLRGACSTGVCQVEPAANGTSCDDGLFCNGDESCSDGACVSGLEPCDQCSTCDETNDQCTVLVNEPCDDDIVCTDDDRCDTAGTCAGTPNHNRCASNEMCVPRCFTGAIGCGLPPEMTVTCDPSLGGDSDAVCTIELVDGREGQGSCLSCRSTFGFVPVEKGEFDDCDNEGWSLAAGNTCSTTATCAAVGTTASTCCADFASICETSLWGSALQSVLEENCGGGFEQWRLSKILDTTGLEDVRFCFDASESYAELDDALIGEVSVGGDSMSLCLGGDTFWRAGYQSLCADLPSWAWNTDVSASFIAHVNSASPSYPSETRRMSLRTPRLSGRDPRCTTGSRHIYFSDNFSGCALSDWTTDGVQCGAGVCAGLGDGVWAENGTGTLTRYADLSDAAGDIELCFAAGNVASPDQNDRYLVEVMTSPVTGWRPAGWGSLYQAPDNQCQQICIGLLAPELVHRPQAGIRVTLESSGAGKRVLLDDISLTATRDCAGDGLASTGAITEATNGDYQVTVSALTAGPITTQVTCDWTGIVPGPSATTTVTLQDGGS